MEFDLLPVSIAPAAGASCANFFPHRARTGVNGNQNDNSYSRPGAAYLFAGIGFGPRLTLMPDGRVGYLIRINGAPGVRQRLQRVPGLTELWDTVSTQTLPASGLIEFHDTNPPPAEAFYRTVQP